MKYGMRERVIGGIILVALAVILVPMFFGSPSERASKRAPTVTVNQTPIESPAPQDIVPPTPPQGVQPSAPQATAPTESQATTTPVEQPQPAPSSYEVAPSEPAKEATPVAPARDNAMGPVRNAPSAAAKPTAPQATPSKPAARPAEPAARPQASTQQPAKLASKDPIMAAAGQQPARPAAPAKPAASAPAPLNAPAEGWSVQAGSFGNADNAQRLVQRLSENGFKAYTLKRAGNVVVMVGPFSSSQAGEQARTELQQRASINGFVVRGSKG